MSLTSPTFLLFVTMLVLCYQIHGSTAYRTCILVTADIVFLLFYITKPEQLGPLGVFLLTGYLCMLCVQRFKSGLLLALLLVLTIFMYIIFKQFSFLPSYARLPFPYLTIGLSYILFRILHMIVDAAEGNLPERVGPVTYVHYTCNLLTFVSGPIQTYQDFRDSASSDPALSQQKVYRAFSRVVTGFVKFAVIAASADYVFDNAHSQLYASSSLVHVATTYAICSVSYTIYLYFNFSGYMDIVIGIGWLLGQDLPENFDHPFRATSFLEFWQRWHMTLSVWFKTYLFNPLLMTMMDRLPRASAPLLGVIAFFITFLVMGIWHGTTFVFVIYGLLMGAGASINKLWQIAVLQRLGRAKDQALKRSLLYQAVCRGMTFAYFAMALTCLWTPQLGDLSTLANHLGAIGLGAIFVVLTLGAALATYLIEQTIIFARYAYRTLGQIGAAPGFAFTGLLLQNLGLAARIALVLIVISTLNKPPEFVYKAF